ncbi:hypothetical protein DFR76_109274 [Nocardia pseudobrasiliensis]|uniref:Uncharacterized protein n=1 Tax=Nocardia pseudobrasiliensis TaxID=45979 RepID=A0A370I3P4_9NOCA|nr:hypothetical protein DFR76_109274 [Nocardia pseudobrasiliensis]
MTLLGWPTGLFVVTGIPLAVLVATIVWRK